MMEFVDRGKILIGIGNGFRVLCETGLVPGTLRMNKTQRFICRNTFIKPDNDHTAVTNKLSNDRLIDSHCHRVWQVYCQGGDPGSNASPGADTVPLL